MPTYSKDKTEEKRFAKERKQAEKDPLYILEKIELSIAEIDSIISDRKLNYFEQLGISLMQVEYISENIKKLKKLLRKK